MLLPLVASLALCTAGSAPAGFAEQVLPVLKAHCFECHSGATPKGDLALDLLRDEAAARAQPETWKLVRVRVSAGEMPPKKKPPLAAGELDTLLTWIDSVPGAGKPPGRTVLRRLNRREYENSVRDLFGVDFDGRERLPADDVGAGFDVLGSVLSLPDSALEKYLRAAEEIAAAAVIADDPEHPPRKRCTAQQLTGGEKETGNPFRALYSNGEVRCELVLPREGEYLVRARAYGMQAGPDPARMALSAGEQSLGNIDVGALRKEPGVYEVRAHLAGGLQRLGAAFLNDYYMPEAPDPQQRDRNLYVEWIEVEGPLDPAPVSAFQRAELGGLSDASVPAALERIAARVWRRPPGREELAQLLAQSSPKAPPFLRVRSALVAMLASPRFLFRLEPDPPGLAPGSLRRLDGHELAARLSYFLWSSTPDARLEELAASGALSADATLEREFGRLLEDPRSGELARGFALQWLELEPLARAAPDPVRFPHFDEGLRASMRAETIAFFDALLRERRPLSDLVDADFSFVDERLAQLYGIPGVRGPELRRVRVDRARRGGLLGQASVLTVTSNPTRTSPVKRGKWILEVLLDCAAASSAAGRGRARGHDQGAGRRLAARAAGDAPRQARVRRMPRPARPARAGARELRRDRRLARERGPPPDRRERRAARRQAHPGPRGPRRGVARGRCAGALDRTAPDGLRARPRARLGRRARAARTRARAAGREDHAGRRAARRGEERALPQHARPGATPMREALDRRTLLRGAAVALALPWLEAMLPRARAAAFAQEAPRRLFYAYVPNGMRMDAWRPAAGFRLERLLAPLAPARDEVLVIRGLAQDAARPYQDGPGDHARAGAAFLTGVHPLKSDGQVLAGISADQLAAQHIGERTRLRSLQLGCDGAATSGNCDSGYACAYTTHISWSGPRTPSGKEHDPRAVFERLFLDEGEPAFGETREQRALRRKSVLDFVREDARKLAGRLGAEDRRKLDEYQSGVRELERRIERLLAGTDKDSAAGLPQQPAGEPEDFAEHVRVMYELAAVALISDVTRVGTFLVTNEGSNRSYPFAGVPEGHHEMSHHGGESDEARAVGEDLRLPQRAVRRLRREAARGEGRRWDRSRAHTGRVRQRHLRRQQAQPRRPPARARRRQRAGRQGRARAGARVGNLAQPPAPRAAREDGRARDAPGRRERAPAAGLNKGEQTSPPEFFALRPDDPTTSMSCVA